jgi:basic membrane protein A
VTRRIRGYGLVAITSVALAGLLAACGSSSSTTPSTSAGASTTTTSKSAASGYKVGLVTDIGGLNDHGFNHLSYEGLLQAESQLGVKGTVLQSTSGADYVPNLSRLAASGNKLVIAVGFLMAAPLEQVAKQYPKTHFAIIDSPGGTAPDTAKNIEGIRRATRPVTSPGCTSSSTTTRRRPRSAARASRRSPCTSPDSRLE